MAHTGPKRNIADTSNLYALQWHATIPHDTVHKPVDDKHHGRRSLSIIEFAKAEASALRALLTCNPTGFETIAIGTYEYCVKRRKDIDALIAHTRHERETQP